MTQMTQWMPGSTPTACPRCRMPVTPAMPQVEASGRALHRECYIAWHFSQTGRYPRRLGHGRSGVEEIREPDGTPSWHGRA